MDDEYIRLDTTIIAIDNLINEAATGSIARALFNAKDVIYSQQRYSADVQPVKRGKWEQDEKGAFHHCSECESKTFRDVDSWGYEYQEYLTDYCFRCGARMVGEQNENN